MSDVTREALEAAAESPHALNCWYFAAIPQPCTCPKGLARLALSLMDEPVVVDSKFRRGFSSPGFEHGAQSEHDAEHARLVAARALSLGVRWPR